MSCGILIKSHDSHNLSKNFDHLSEFIQFGRLIEWVGYLLCFVRRSLLFSVESHFFVCNKEWKIWGHLDTYYMIFHVEIHRFRRNTYFHSHEKLSACLNWPQKLFTEKTQKGRGGIYAESVFVIIKKIRKTCKFDEERYHLGAMNHSFCVVFLVIRQIKATHTIFLAFSVFQMCFDHLLIGLNEMWIGTACPMLKPMWRSCIAVFASIIACASRGQRENVTFVFGSTTTNYVHKWWCRWCGRPV